MRTPVRLSLTALIAITLMGQESEAGAWWRRGFRRRQPVAAPPYPPQTVYVYPTATAPPVVYADAPALTVAAPPPPPVTPPLVGVTPPDPSGTAGRPPRVVPRFQLQGKVYEVIPTDDRGESEEEDLRDRSTALVGRAGDDGEHFVGKARKAAKTSFASAATETYPSVAALIDVLLGGETREANDAELRGRLHANSPRSPAEERNVTVTAYLYASKKESDNDFHLLIGTDPAAPGTARYMTAEISGLPNPDDADTSEFAAVRAAYRSFFASAGLETPGDRYVRFSPPVPVTITGSVFFDVDHRIGEVRTGAIAPATVWEVHPVSDLQFGSAGGN